MIRRIRPVQSALGCAAALLASLLLAHIHPWGDVEVHVAGGQSLPPVAPPAIQALLATKCADCHSTATHLPVYAKFAPASWLVERDIAEGRKHFNLSQWQQYTPEQQETLKAKMVAEVRNGAMPPWQYRLIHHAAATNAADLQVLVAWSRQGAGLAESSSTGEGDATRGKTIFEKRCTGCHAIDAEREGPRLRGVFNGPAGSVAGYDYSAALKKSHLVWNAVTLDQWLTDPDALVPGNNMEFRVVKGDERRDLIRYLSTLKDK